MNKEEIKLCEIINSYAIRRIGNLSINEEEALKKYESFCIELIKENKELHNKIDKAIEIIEKYNIGKYDYSISPIGIMDLLEILKEVE